MAAAFRVFGGRRGYRLTPLCLLVLGVLLLPSSALPAGADHTVSAYVTTALSHDSSLPANPLVVKFTITATSSLPCTWGGTGQTVVKKYDGQTAVYPLLIDGDPPWTHTELIEPGDKITLTGKLNCERVGPHDGYYGAHDAPDPAVLNAYMELPPCGPPVPVKPGMPTPNCPTRLMKGEFRKLAEMWRQHAMATSACTSSFAGASDWQAADVCQMTYWGQGEAIALAFAFDQLANDPPDPHYTALARPKPLPVPSLSISTTSAQGREALAAARAFMANEAAATAYAKVLLTSLERAQGAFNAHSVSWTRRQNQAAAAAALRVAQSFQARSDLVVRVERAFRGGKKPAIVKQALAPLRAATLVRAELQATRALRAFAAQAGST